jgi:hypothetical protein
MPFDPVSGLFYQATKDTYGHFSGKDRRAETVDATARNRLRQGRAQLQRHHDQANLYLNDHEKLIRNDGVQEGRSSMALDILDRGLKRVPDIEKASKVGRGWAKQHYPSADIDRPSRLTQVELDESAKSAKHFNAMLKEYTKIESMVQQHLDKPFKDEGFFD